MHSQGPLMRIWCLRCNGMYNICQWTYTRTLNREFERCRCSNTVSVVFQNVFSYVESDSRFYFSSFTRFRPSKHHDYSCVYRLNRRLDITSNTTTASFLASKTRWLLFGGTKKKITKNYLLPTTDGKITFILSTRTIVLKFMREQKKKKPNDQCS